MKIVDKRTARYLGMLLNDAATVVIAPPSAFFNSAGTAAVDVNKCTKIKYAVGVEFDVEVPDGSRVALIAGDSPSDNIVNTDTGAKVHTASIETTGMIPGYPMQYLLLSPPMHAGDIFTTLA